MKIYFLTFVLLINTAFAFNIPEGIYEGTGTIYSQSSNSTYITKLSIDSAHVNTQYKLSNGEQKNWNFSYIKTQGESFDVIYLGFNVGQGLCSNQKKSCYYKLNYSKEKLEESFHYNQNQLTRYGSKIVDQEKITWKEVYLKQR